MSGDQRMTKTTFSGIRTPALRQALGLAVCLASISCSNSQTQTNRSQLAGVQSIAPTVKESPNGSIVTQYDGSSRARVAQVQIPRGALAVDQKITVRPTHHTDPSDLRSDFGIKPSNRITETNVATVVSSNIDSNLKQPMVIALDLPPATSGLMNLVWDQRHFFVVYTIRDAKTDTWKRGIMPDKALSLKDSRVMFQTQYLGRYEVFESVEKVQPKVQEKPVSKPSLDSRPVAITKVTPVIAKPGDTVTIHGKYLSKDTKVFIGVRAAANVTYTAERTLVVKVPSISPGPTNVKVAEGTNSDTAELVIHNSSLPFANTDAGEICEGITFINGNGRIRPGTKECVLEPCNKDNQIGCKATADFRALRTSLVNGWGYFQGVRIQGKAGMVKIPSYTNSCQNENQVGCRIDGDRMALRTKSLSANVLKNGVTVPQVFIEQGSNVGIYPNHATFNLGGNTIGYGALTATGFSAAVIAAKDSKFQFWDVDGKAHTFSSEGSLTPQAIKPGVVIHGVRGPAGAESGGYCNQTGDEYCKLKTGFKAAARSLLVPGNIRNNQPMGKIMGAYPSVKYPLDPNSEGKAELTNANYDQSMWSDAEFIYFDSAGVKRTAKGSKHLHNRNVLVGKTVFRRQGWMDEFKRDDFKPENIRHGLTIKDVKGTMRVHCSNLANTNIHDVKNDTEGMTKVGLDIYDTITDTTMPKENPWPKWQGADCTENNWQDITVAGQDNGCGNSLKASCIFKNKVTGRVWGGYDPSARGLSKSEAMSYCKSGKWGGITNWQLASKTELLQGSLSGLRYLGQKYSSNFGKVGDQDGYFSTRSLDHADNLNPSRRAWWVAVSINTGLAKNFASNQNLPVICTQEMNN